MNHVQLSVPSALILLSILSTSRAAAPGGDDFVVLPNTASPVQFRLYTNAAPDAAHLFNMFDLQAHGELLLTAPAGKGLQRALAASPPEISLHSVLVNGQGPELASTNGMNVIEEAIGPDWRYVALDATAAYRDRLTQFRRGVLFVEPDLFVLHDHLTAKEPVGFRMSLHPSSATHLDAAWGDLRLDLPNAGVRINTPGRKTSPRSWSRVPSAADSLLPGTVTMELGPTNKLAQFDIVTVFAVYRAGEKKSYSFKLLESNTAVGAQIHRDGLPTLVAFKTAAGAADGSLAGFGFHGPVGVYVFKPKR
jgi:hypothetical protein